MAASRSPRASRSAAGRPRCRVRRAAPRPGAASAPLLRRTLLTVAALLAAWPAAGDAGPEAAVAAYLRLWSGGDPATAGEVVADGFRRHARPGESPASPEALAELIRATRERFDRVRVEAEELFCDGDRCVLVGSFTGGIPGSDRGVDIPLVAFYRTAGGRVAEEWLVANQLPTMFGLGYKLVPPGYTLLPGDGEPVPVPLPAEPTGTAGAVTPRAPPVTSPPVVAGGGDDLRSLVLAYLAAWGTGETAALDRIVADDFQRSDWNGHVRSRQELAQRIGEDRRNLAGLDLELHDLIVAGDRAAARLTLHGTWRDTGAVIAAPVHAVFRAAQGRLVSEYPLGDHVAFMEGLGCRVVRPGEKAVPPPIESPPPPRPDLAAAVDALAVAAAELSAAAPRSAAVVGITSRTLGRLRVDGRPLGLTAPGHRVELRLAPGRHAVTLRSLGGRPVAAESLELGRGEVREVAVGPPGRVLVDLRSRVSEDLTTGLLWTLVDNGEDVTWHEARAYCDALELAGADDWRLPDIRELEPLYDPQSTKDWRTVPGVELSSCCPWSANLHGEAMAWSFVSYKGSRYLRYLPFRRYQRAVCVRSVW